MAPAVFAAMTSTQEHLSLSHKLRKPLVEKLRRERINSCIEQLKSLLDPEFLKQQPDSKLEKADILEMTVCFLTQLRQQNLQQKKLLGHFSRRQDTGEPDITPMSPSSQNSSSSKEKSSGSEPLWRPW